MVLDPRTARGSTVAGQGRRTVKRRVTLGVLVAALVLGVAPAARAHPLGNFTVNRYAEVVVGPESVTVRYVLDLAEIPSFQEL